MTWFPLGNLGHVQMNDVIGMPSLKLIDVFKPTAAIDAIRVKLESLV
jgi:hypothetical protein